MTTLSRTVIIVAGYWAVTPSFFFPLCFGRAWNCPPRRVSDGLSQNESCRSLNLVFNAQCNNCLNQLSKGCCANVIIIYSFEVSVFLLIHVIRLKQLQQQQNSKTTAKMSGSNSKLSYSTWLSVCLHACTESKEIVSRLVTFETVIFVIIKICCRTTLFDTYWRYAG